MIFRPIFLFVVEWKCIYEKNMGKNEAQEIDRESNDKFNFAFWIDSHPFVGYSIKLVSDIPLLFLSVFAYVDVCTTAWEHLSPVGVKTKTMNKIKNAEVYLHHNQIKAV